MLTIRVNSFVATCLQLEMNATFIQYKEFCKSCLPLQCARPGQLDTLFLTWTTFFELQCAVQKSVVRNSGAINKMRHYIILSKITYGIFKKYKSRSISGRMSGRKSNWRVKCRFDQVSSLDRQMSPAWGG